MAILNIDNTVPVENLSGACGQFSQAFSFDFPVCRALEGEVPVESIAELELDGVLNVEVLANLGVDKQTAVEIVVANSNFDFLFPVELLASIADDEIIPISYLGIGIPIEALVWILNSRVELWSLDSRENTWSPITREDIMSLNARLSEHKPEGRENTWSL